MAPSILNALEMPQYPTPQEIMHDLQYPQEELLSIVRTWKRDHFNRKWAAADEPTRMAAVKQMTTELATAAGRAIRIVDGEWYCAFPDGHTLVFGPKASIISALHELGHLIHGASELEACRFSVALFIAVFPKQFEKLEWKGHMLVVPQAGPALPQAVDTTEQEEQRDATAEAATHSEG